MRLVFINPFGGRPANTVEESRVPTPRRVPLLRPKEMMQFNPRVDAFLKQFQETPKDRLRQINAEALARKVEAINRFLEESVQYKTLEFRIHEESGRQMVFIVDRETGSVQKQIPSQQVLTLSAQLKAVTGLLMDTQG